ncbi:MAG: caspase family protein [Myxococcota bacterium]|nr:caspase family protein [Myxococcota bacterium]
MQKTRGWVALGGLARGWVARGALALTLIACGGDEEETSSAAEQTAESVEETPAAPAGPLLEEAGELAGSDASDGRGRYDRYFVQVAEGERVLVELTSDAFDPFLEVTPPGSGALVNDDWQGDRTRSQLELIAPAAGQMKIEVRAYADQGEGAYRLVARRVEENGESVPVLTAGRSAQGELAQGDHTLTGGELFDAYVVRLSAAGRIRVQPTGDAELRTSVVSPSGHTLQGEGHVYRAPNAGNYNVQVIGRQGAAYTVSVESAEAEAAPLLARAHHQFSEILDRLRGAGRDTPPVQPAQAQGTTPAANPTPSASPQPRALPIRVGDRVTGNLAQNDPTLPSGERYDVYELTVDAPQAGEVAVELESSAFDTFLRVDGPGGQHWENDDHAGTLNSRLTMPLGTAGTYRIVATSYRAGEVGPYELKVLTSRATAPADAPSGPEQRIEGSLAEGDTTLQSGEYMDEHTFEWPAGSRVHLEAQSDDFDTYLIVHPPSGAQRDNDDMVPGQTLNAGMDLQVEQGGRYRVVVTSYRPGETGRYALVLRGAPSTGTGSAPQANGSGATATPTPTPTPTPTATPTPAGARTETGTLAQGDRTLQSGELADTFTMSFTPQSAVQIRLESSDFDTYLIVRSPSGHQEDNDDLTPGQSLNSGLDIPVAEPGDYTITVTSYRPGETGSYRLVVTEGQSVVAPPPSTGPAAAPGETGRVWGLFAGITDYPGSVNDLPECANDARKLAEAVRNQGNMPSGQEFLLTDGQATTANLRQAMQTIAQRIRPDDVLVFFYSGHGGQTDSSTDTRELDRQDEYLLLHDGRMMDDELGQLFDGVNARVALVAIDACFAGGFAKDVITRPGRVGMFSSEEDVTSAVAGRFQAGGYLSHFLRLGINGEADNDPHNAILTVGELTHYTWRQFGQHASDVRMSMGYQHLVVDRGAVHTTEVLWAVRR